MVLQNGGNEMMSRRVIAMLANALLLSLCAAQKVSPSTSEIQQLLLGDQADRGAGPPSVAGKKRIVSPEQLAANDRARRKRVRELLDQGVLQSGADFSAAAVIYQHGEKPDDYLLAHVLAMIALAKGDQPGRGIAAATLDRYLQSVGQPQVFGTQYLTRGYAKYLESRRVSSATLDKGQGQAAEEVTKNQPESHENKPNTRTGVPSKQDAREWTEFVQTPYNPSLIDDPVRSLFCVPGIEQQKQNLASMNAGEEVSEKPIAGCSH
jgi:hypothetical protein